MKTRQAAALAALLTLLFAGCTGTETPGPSTTTSNPPSSTSTTTQPSVTTQEQPPEPVKTSDHNADYDLGNFSGGRFQQTSGYNNAPENQTVRLALSFEQRQGAAVIPMDWTALRPYSAHVSVTGAFLREGRILEDAPDSWFFARTLLLGSTTIDHAFNQFNFHGNLLTALNDPFWADLLSPDSGGGGSMSQGYDHPSHYSDARFALVVAWQMPPEATSLAIALCGECNINKTFDQGTALERLATHTDHSYVARPAAETDRASLAYWASQDYWGNARMTEGIRNVVVEKDEEIPLADVATVNQTVRVDVGLSTLEGWGEAYVWWHDNTVPAGFDFLLIDGQHRERTWNTDAQPEGPYGIEFGGINNNASFTDFSFWVHKTVSYNKALGDPRVDSPGIYLYAVQTDLDVAAALKQNFIPRYFAVPNWNNA